MLFKVKNLSLILLVSYGISLVNAAQVDPDPGAAGPANPVVLGEGRMPKALEVLAARVVARALFDQNEAQINGYFQAHAVPLVLREEVIRQYYLLRGQHMPGIPEAKAQEIYRFSIQELLDNGRIPVTVNGWLDLSECYVADLDGLAQIPGVNNLQKLWLKNNQITQIHPNAFQRLGNLEVLYLHNNQITQIHPNAFQGLGNLRELRLSDNQITQIHPDTFQGLGNLAKLFLHVNQIAQIHPDAFQGLDNLQDLHLDNNQITLIHPNAFQGLGDLRYLSLFNNPITQIQPDAFQGLGNLQRLHLYNNQITQIHPNTFQGLGNLRGLYLQSNQIAQIHPNAFQGLGNLQILNLSNNPIIPDQRVQLREQIQGEVGHRIDIVW